MAADNRVFAKELVDEIVARLNIADLENATIGEVLLVASALEEKTGIPFIRMDQGSPGLPPNRIGIEAERRPSTAASYRSTLRRQASRNSRNRRRASSRPFWTSTSPPAPASRRPEA